MTNLKTAKTVLQIGENLIDFNIKEGNIFVFFVKSPVNQTFIVDWGDGNECMYNGSDKHILLSHNYWSLETFEITIQRVITMFVCNVCDFIGGYREISGNSFCIEACDMRDNPYIEALECRGELMLQNNYVLKELDRFAVGISGIDLSQLPALECIDFMDSFYTGALDFSNNPKLKYLRCPYNYISSLDVSRCPDLEYIDICYADKYCRLDLENNHKLKYLFADGIAKENIRLPKGGKVIMNQGYKISEKYWTLLGD